VYFQPREGGAALQLFDGDRIAVLAALLVQDLLKGLPLDAGPPTVRPPFRMQASRSQ
jgi:hypothetical protein